MTGFDIGIFAYTVGQLIWVTLNGTGFHWIGEFAYASTRHAAHGENLLNGYDDMKG